MAKRSARSANIVDEHVGSRIRIRRQILGMSQEKLGDQLGVTFQQVQKYERGSNRVGASRLYDVARVLEVPVGFFYEGLDESGAVEGFSENDQQPIVYDFIKSSEGVQLAIAMSRIPDRSLRRQIVDLARAIAESSEKNTV